MCDREAIRATSSEDCESEALHARAAELTALVRHLMLIVEREKAELARELHDTFGSNLTAINMDLNWVIRRLPEERTELQERLQRAQRILGETVVAKQAIIDRLRPSQLDTLGLAAALRTHCREVETRAGAVCAVEAAEDFENLDGSLAIALYRVAQDALASVESGEHVRIDLVREDGDLCMKIRDVGASTRAIEQRLATKGLVSMRERIGAVGGTLQIHASTAGAAVEVRVPELVGE